MSGIRDTDEIQPAQESDKSAISTLENRENEEITNDVSNGEEKSELRQLLDIESELDEEIAKMKAELDAGPSMKETMERLHEYNEIKDAAQKVLGAIASMQGVTIASLHKEYNLPMGDEQ